MVHPKYPPKARYKHIEGSVVLKAVIGKDGRIKDLQTISGPPELIESAIKAVKQWRYKPYMLMGQPIDMDTEITVTYTMGG